MTRFGAALWGLAGAAACAAVAPLEPNLLEEGFIVEAAQRMLRGDVLYRDVVTFTGPLPYALLAALFDLFGEEIAVGRAAVVALHGAATACAFGLARRGGAGALAHVAAALLASTPLLLFPLFSLFFYTTLAFHFTWLAAWAASRGTRSPAWAAAAGAGVACVALCKQSVGLPLALALPAALAWGAPSGARLRAVGAAALGGAAVAAATLVLYAARGDLAPLVDSLVWLPLSFEPSYESPYPNLWPPGVLRPEIAESKAYYFPFFYTLRYGIAVNFMPAGAGMVLAAQLLYALPFAALLATAVRTALRGTRAPVAWIGAAALAASIANLFPRSDWGHLVFVLPFAAVQWVLLLPEAPAARTRLRVRAAAVLVAALAAGSLGVALWLYSIAGPASFGPRVPLRPVSESYRGPAIPRVIDFLRRNAREGESIFVARAEPLLYFATDTRNPTPYGGVIPGMRDAQERDILAALGDVRFVVMSEIDQPLYTYYADELPAVQDYFERHFALPDVFARNEDAWLVVLERGEDRGPTAVDLFRLRAQGRAWIRDALGREQPARGQPPRLVARHNRRPLAVLLGARGGGIDFELELPPRPRLELDVGRWQMTGPRAVYRHPRGTRLGVAVRRDGAEGFERLESRRVKPGQEWAPVAVDLAAYAGERVTLRLEVASDGPQAPGAFAWWGSPRIVSAP